MGCGTSKETQPLSPSSKPPGNDFVEPVTSAPVSEAVNIMKREQEGATGGSALPAGQGSSAVSGKQTVSKVTKVVNEEVDVFEASDDPDIAEVDRLLELSTQNKPLDLQPVSVKPPPQSMAKLPKLQEDLEAEDMENNAAKWLQKPSNSKLPSISRANQGSKYDEAGEADDFSSSPLYANSKNYSSKGPEDTSLRAEPRTLSFQQQGFTDLNDRGYSPSNGQQQNGQANQDLQMMEDLLSKPDPWASLQTQYRIKDERPSSSGRAAREYSPSGRSVGNLDKEGELVLFDDDDEGPRFIKKPTASAGVRRRQNPPPMHAIEAGGQPKRGGWGQGQLAAAGTLMVGEDEFLEAGSHHSRPYAPRTPDFADRELVQDRDMVELAPPHQPAMERRGKQTQHQTDIGVEEIDDVDALIESEARNNGTGLSKDLASKLKQFEQNFDDEDNTPVQQVATKGPRPVRKGRW